ncbi:MAG: hypothetical protein ABII68_10970 [Pseudomonadota bacterium]
MKTKCIAVVIFACCLFTSASADRGELTLPDMPPQRLQGVGWMSFQPIKESSGLLRSRRWPGVFWTHNDSRNPAQIFAVRVDGSIVKPERITAAEYTGIRVIGAENVDWEDIALDADGNLYIGDFGNNWNERRDLAVYVLKEPNPFEDTDARVRLRIPFEYPDQNQYPPPEERNFDAEALFFDGGRLYILTKHRGDTKTSLYRFETLVPGRMNRLELLGEFDTRERVTAADISPDGSRLVVLTYGAIWMFERAAAEPESWLDGRVWWLPVKNCGTCEGVSFSDDTILISSERRELFRVPVTDLVRVRD